MYKDTALRGGNLTLRQSNDIGRFLIEEREKLIGTCGLRQMDLRRLTGRWPNLDLRRIDLVMSDETAWVRGAPAEAIRALTRFGIESDGVNAIFACDIPAHDKRARCAFADAGYLEEVRAYATAQPWGTETIDMVVWQEPVPGAGLPVDDPMLTEAEVLECLELLSRCLSASFWIGGGVGVDLAVGRLTRQHGDIDVCIDYGCRAYTFAELSQAGFRVTKDLGWHTRWSRSSRVIGELDICFMTIHPDGSGILIVCPEFGIGEPGRYPSPPGTFDEQRYGQIAGVRCRIESAQSQIRIRQGYRSLFPGASENPKVGHDLDLLASVAGADQTTVISTAPLHREHLLPGDCDN